MSPRREPTPRAAPPATPDGRYLVVDGRLWRRSNPALGPTQRALLVEALMHARRDVGFVGGPTITLAMGIEDGEHHPYAT